MTHVSTRILIRKGVPRSRYRRQQRSHQRQSRGLRVVYREPVSQPPEVSRARFAKVIDRMLNQARTVGGMNDSAIASATGVSATTFYRWRRGEFTKTPDISMIRRFCDGLGVPAEPALRALGITVGADDPAPEAPIPPDVRRILRGLTDPNVSEFDKTFVRETLKMLANRVTAGRHGS